MNVLLREPPMMPEPDCNPPPYEEAHDTDAVCRIDPSINHTKLSHVGLTPPPCLVIPLSGIVQSVCTSVPYGIAHELASFSSVCSVCIRLVMASIGVW